jgi:VIT1/CCC1 family predicted Fe2+/Mn2+ transporter/rubrerythrin
MTTYQASDSDRTRKRLLAALEDARERELRAAELYRLLGDREPDERRKGLFYRLAEEEAKHARLFGERITANGGALRDRAAPLSPADRLLAKTLGTEAMLRRMEAEEEKNIAVFEAQADAIDSDPESRSLFEQIEKEEEHHGNLLRSMAGPNSAQNRLDHILQGERWHVNTGTWIGDAIYGMNDGLTAVFGIVSGMAGLTAGHQDRVGLVVGAGMMAMLASALSMGASAYLASKAEREVYEAEIGRERQEIEESPEHEVEELSLIYQLKGFSEEESRRMAKTIAAQPETFLKTMAHEELGLSERNFGSPWSAAITGTVATAIGGIVPVLPFFFTFGAKALIVSAVVSILAHFAVGAAKTLVTARSWFLSGLEMTVVGVGVGLVTYVLGEVFKAG